MQDLRSMQVDSSKILSMKSRGQKSKSKVKERQKQIKLNNNVTKLLFIDFVLSLQETLLLRRHQNNTLTLYLFNLRDRQLHPILFLDASRKKNRFLALTIVSIQSTIFNSLRVVFIFKTIRLLQHSLEFFSFHFRYYLLTSKYLISSDSMQFYYLCHFFEELLRSVHLLYKVCFLSQHIARLFFLLLNVKC